MHCLYCECSWLTHSRNDHPRAVKAESQSHYGGTAVSAKGLLRAATPTATLRI